MKIDGFLQVAPGKYAAIGWDGATLLRSRRRTHVWRRRYGDSNVRLSKLFFKELRSFGLAEDVRTGSLTTHNSHRQLGSSTGLRQERLGCTSDKNPNDDDLSGARKN